ncbi:unnamed protein product [Adineta steineri]|uniref:G domain-containing protein n=1 Tax=Adineta steineri TaxID=433720 RepID=A0A816GRC6_9BILA|nr:unnamed protein product [Adineta steineri]CAF1676502.1 unnamed protein product [Adineta steineri]
MSMEEMQRKKEAQDNERRAWFVEIENQNQNQKAMEEMQRKKEAQDNEHRTRLEEIENKNQKAMDEIQRKKEAQDNEHRTRLEEIENKNQKVLEEMQRKEEAQKKEHHARLTELQIENEKLMEQIQRKEEAQKEKDLETAARYNELYKRMEQYQEAHKTQMEQMTKLLEDLKKKKLTSFEDIAENDKEAKEAIIKLAKEAKPFEMEGNNIALFGRTSCGKSTMLNKLHGKEVAETGKGETTLKIQSYQATDFVLWDIPGKNDEVSYLSLQYISFFKGLTHRIILVTDTLKENSSMMKLLDAIGLNYDIVVNKMDECDDEEQPKFREKIKEEVQTLELKGVDRIFYVSAKFPAQFPDWLAMVDYLTDPRK